MDVTVLRSTEQPERLVFRAGRGDYYDGFVGKTHYDELVNSVNYDEEHVERVKEIRDCNHPKRDGYWEEEAATLSFIEKQLSRGHYGLWEHPQITFAVKGVSRVTMAQITRHRHMSFDVQSQRYVDFGDKEAITPKSLVDENHFTRDTGVVELENVDREYAQESYEDRTEEAFDWYERMVEHGVPKEDARFMLPVGTPVNITMSGNARTMMHVLNLRQKANAQWEVRQLSEKIVDHLEEWMPYTGAWWKDNGPMKISP